MTFSFPEKLPKKWLKIVKDSRGTIVKTGRDSFKILHNGKNQDTFGYTVKGPNVLGLPADAILGGRPHACPRVGTATSITVYLSVSGGNLPKLKCAIYKDTDDTLVGVTEEWTMTPAYDGWKTFDIVGVVPLIPMNYILCIWGDKAFNVYQNPVAGYFIAGDADVYDGVYPDPCPWSVGKTWQSSKKYSIYVTYDPLLVGGGTGAVVMGTKSLILNLLLEGVID